MVVRWIWPGWTFFQRFRGDGGVTASWPSIWLEIQNCSKVKNKKDNGKEVDWWHMYISVSKYLRGVYGKVMDIVLFSADLSAELARLLFPDWAAPSGEENNKTYKQFVITIWRRFANLRQDRHRSSVQFGYHIFYRSGHSGRSRLRRWTTRSSYRR